MNDDRNKSVGPSENSVSSFSLLPILYGLHFLNSVLFIFCLYRYQDSSKTTPCYAWHYL